MKTWSKPLAYWCLISLTIHVMKHRNQFRLTLPASQTLLAAVLGGWGLWLRNSILSRPFWGDSTLWHSTARYHIWPWPFKFVAVLNMPALAAGALLSLAARRSPPGTSRVVFGLNCSPLCGIALVSDWGAAGRLGLGW